MTGSVSARSQGQRARRRQTRGRAARPRARSWQRGCGRKGVLHKQCDYGARFLFCLAEKIPSSPGRWQGW